MECFYITEYYTLVVTPRPLDDYYDEVLTGPMWEMRSKHPTLYVKIFKEISFENVVYHIRAGYVQKLWGVEFPHTFSDLFEERKFPAEFKPLTEHEKFGGFFDWDE